MKKLRILIPVLLLISVSVLAQKSEVFVKSGSAINGYDAVSYFTDGKPVKGNAKFSFSWKGANWLFATQQHLDAFKTNPEKYAPQYGGYCAYGLADGHKAPTLPEAWTIANGKLYLNYNLDVQSLWKKKQEEYIVTADKNWPELKDRE